MTCSLGLYYTTQHVRRKHLKAMVRLKFAQSKRLNVIRRELAEPNISLPKENVEKAVESGKKRLDQLADRMEALFERANIVTEIEHSIQTTPTTPSGPSSAWTNPEDPSSSSGSRLDSLRKSFKSIRMKATQTPPQPQTVRNPLPVGMGQLLDDHLMRGEMDIDDYALKMAKLANTYEEMAYVTPTDTKTKQPKPRSTTDKSSS